MFADKGLHGGLVERQSDEKCLESAQEREGDSVGAAHQSGPLMGLPEASPSP